MYATFEFSFMDPHSPVTNLLQVLLPDDVTSGIYVDTLINASKHGFRNIGLNICSL
jgi:hypothetical protein